MSDTAVPTEHLEDVALLWDYLQLHQELHPADVAIGLGSHDPTVPEVAVDLFKRGLVPRLVFTGSNAPTTIERYPRGEAVHYGEYTAEHRVPTDAVLLETHARYTAENFTLTRELLDAQGVDAAKAIVVCRPYQQRRAYRIAAKVWPSLSVICASTSLSLTGYVRRIGDADLVINMMVGDAYRLSTDVEDGNSEPHHIPQAVEAAVQRLTAAGYTSRLPDR